MSRFVCVQDAPPEYSRALQFAAGRAATLGARLTILAILPPAEFQHWGGVARVMEAEAMRGAQSQFDVSAVWAKHTHGVQAELEGCCRTN